MHSTPMVSRSSVRGFTLIEVVLVVLMIAVLLAMTAFSFMGLGGSDPVRGTGDELIRLSKQAVKAAAIQGRPFTIQFTEDSFTLSGWEGKGSGSVPLEKGTSISILRWGQKEWIPAEGQVWMFGGNGLCDPIKVRIDSGGSRLEMGFNPLTGSPTEQTQTTLSE